MPVLAIVAVLLIVIIFLLTVMIGVFFWFFLRKRRQYKIQEVVSDTEKIPFVSQSILDQQPQNNLTNETALTTTQVMHQPVLTSAIVPSGGDELPLSALECNVLHTVAVKTISVGEEKTREESKGFFIAIHGTFEVNALGEYATKEKIAQSLREQLKNQPDGFNFEFDEKCIGDLAYTFAVELSSVGGTSSKYEFFSKKSVISRDKFKFQSAQECFECSPHFENEGEMYVNASVIIQGVKAINAEEGARVFDQLPQKFLDIPQGKSQNYFPAISPKK